MTQGEVTTTGPAPAAAARTLQDVDRWALVAGVTGVVANGLLATLWAVAIPGNEAYEWTGPANDVVGAVSTAATIPVVVGLTRHLDGPQHVVVLARATVAGAGLMILASGLLVTNVIPFSMQAVVAVPYIGVLFGWLWAAGRSARRSGRLPRRLAGWAEALGGLVVAALPLAGVAALLPQGSLAQYAVGGVALAGGLVGFAGQPVWLIALSHRLAAGTQG